MGEPTVPRLRYTLDVMAPNTNYARFNCVMPTSVPDTSLPPEVEELARESNPDWDIAEKDGYLIVRFFDGERELAKRVVARILCRVSAEEAS